MWANFAQRPPWQEDHLPKKTTFGPAQKWSPYQGSTVCTPFAKQAVCWGPFIDQQDSTMGTKNVKLL